ncbi:MAG: glycosyltransferase family 4 protein [Prevotella sp.]|nr:glycosyltransferase family 4 protein [Prevotella sp.]
MRIVYVIDSLASKGGAERILTDKMNYMTAHYGYEVYVITCYQDISRMPNAYQLSELVNQINLSIPYHSQYRYHYPRRLWVKWRLFRQLCKELETTVRRINPDVLVGLGYFNADLVSGLRCHAQKVIESHEARIFTMSNQGLSRSLPSRLFMHWYKGRYFRHVERQADVVVVLTTGDAREWQKAKRVEVIPNFTVMPVRQKNTNDSKRVIAVGRLEWQKGFDRLIEVWTLVARKHPDWQLDIFGSGTMEAQIQTLIAKAGLKNVAIHPFTPHISEEYTRSSIFGLSSRFEGFGLVLLEAMQAGLPCVVFDCPFGPSDVVTDGTTGFVVADGDVQTFANRLCTLIENETIRKNFSAAAIERVRHYDADQVMMQWKQLFEELANSRYNHQSI